MTQDLGRFVWHLAHRLSSAILAYVLSNKRCPKNPENKFKPQLSPVFPYHHPIISFFLAFYVSLSLCIVRHAFASPVRKKSWQVDSSADSPNFGLQALTCAANSANKTRCNLRVGHLMATRLASLRDVSTHDLPLPRAKWSTSNRFRSSRIEFSSRNSTFSNDMDSHGPHHCPSTWDLATRCLSCTPKHLLLQSDLCFWKGKKPKEDQTKRLVTCKGATMGKTNSRARNKTLNDQSGQSKSCHKERTPPKAWDRQRYPVQPVWHPTSLTLGISSMPLLPTRKCTVLICLLENSRIPSPVVLSFLRCLGLGRNLVVPDKVRTHPQRLHKIITEWSETTEKVK